MSRYISASLKAQVFAADGRRCCYCKTSEANSGIPMTVDHIVPRSKGGTGAFENLCLACRTCNEFKSDAVEVLDPVTAEAVALFHPREQAWVEHFAWSDDGLRVEGLTPVGRATVVALRMNNSIILAARERWVISGWHPPS